jgi:hypothetical protein
MTNICNALRVVRDDWESLRILGRQVAKRKCLRKIIGVVDLGRIKEAQSGKKGNGQEAAITHLCCLHWLWTKLHLTKEVE